MINFLDLALVDINSNLRDVLKGLTWGGQAVFFKDKNNKILGSMSDGDFRRALINGANLDSRAFPFANKSPVLVSEGSTKADIINLMDINLIRAIPIIDNNGQISKIAHIVSKTNNVKTLRNVFFIFAGGKGERMKPYTNECPKPMLKVAGKPMLLHIIEKARSEGFYRFIIATNYLGDIIRNYFGNGKKFGVEISYLNEKNPLGTAGALSLVKDTFLEPVVVTNGDVLTELNYKFILNYQKENRADACVALVKEFEKLKYGVVKVSDGNIVSIEEKPIVSRLVNAGVYVLTPEVISFLKHGETINITTLLSKMIASGKKIVGYQLHENWSDIGHPKDLENANSVYGEKKNEQ